MPPGDEKPYTLGLIRCQKISAGLYPGLPAGRRIRRQAEQVDILMLLQKHFGLFRFVNAGIIKNYSSFPAWSALVQLCQK